MAQVVGDHIRAFDVEVASPDEVANEVCPHAAGPCTPLSLTNALGRCSTCELVASARRLVRCLPNATARPSLESSASRLPIGHVFPSLALALSR